MSREIQYALQALPFSSPPLILSCLPYMEQCRISPVSSSLAAAFPDRVKLPDQPAVLNINMSGEGKYAFVELRDEDMASAALQLNGLDLCGRPLACGML